MGFRSMMDSHTCLRGSAKRKSGAFALSLAVAMGAGLLSPRAFAQSPEELQAARELFQEAFKDEQEKRYPDALEKFERVAKVKESASVRYRIATVLVAMGRLREARDMYRALAAAKSSLPPSDQETADSAAERAAELHRRIPKLAVRVQDNPPADVRLTVDGAPVPVSTTPRVIELDPGDHVIAATARDSQPYEQTISVTDGGGEVAHTVTFTPERGPLTSISSDKTLPWVVLGAGAALAVTGGALLVAREGTIDDIATACPGNVCPTSLREEIEADRDRAHLFGPLGGALSIVGLAAMGAGAYFLLRSPAAGQKATTHLVTPKLGGMRLALTF